MKVDDYGGGSGGENDGVSWPRSTNSWSKVAFVALSLSSFLFWWKWWPKHSVSVFKIRNMFATDLSTDSPSQTNNFFKFFFFWNLLRIIHFATDSSPSQTFATEIPSLNVGYPSQRFATASSPSQSGCLRRNFLSVANVPSQNHDFLVVNTKLWAILKSTKLWVLPESIKICKGLPWQ